MQSVVELIKAHFGQKVSVTGSYPPIPDFPVPSHKEPRFSCFVESEAAGVSSTFLLVLSMDVRAVASEMYHQLYIRIRTRISF